MVVFRHLDSMATVGVLTRLNDPSIVTSVLILILHVEVSFKVSKFRIVHSLLYMKSDR